ncbi:MAG: hypothetical protein IT317_03345 [Anaerolineales bacterium]|nr:hypothetical protein [Anaerolineales bacterium]
MIPEPGNPQSLNRYTYSNNNPIRFIDPSGHDGIDALSYLFGIAYGWTHANLQALGPLVAPPAMQQFEALAIDSNAFNAGRVVGGMAAMAQGVGEVGGGSTIAGGGVAACATGVLCLAGAPAIVEGLAIAGHGAAVGVYGAAEAGQATAMLMAGGRNSKGPFRQNGVRTTDHFWEALEDKDITEQQAWNAYSNGRTYTNRYGQKVMYDPKTGVTIVINEDGAIITTWTQEGPGSDWTPGYNPDGD